MGCRNDVQIASTLESIRDVVMRALVNFEIGTEKLQKIPKSFSISILQDGVLFSVTCVSVQRVPKFGTY